MSDNNTSSPDAVHGAGLEVHQHGSGHELAAGHELVPLGLLLGRQPHRLVVVHIDPLQLQLRGARVGPGGVDTWTWVSNIFTGYQIFLHRARRR